MANCLATPQYWIQLRAKVFLNGDAVHRTSMPLFILTRAIRARTACARGSARRSWPSSSREVRKVPQALIRSTSSARSGRDGATRPIAWLEASAHRQRRSAAKLRGVVVARGVVVVDRRSRRCVGPARNGVALAGATDDMPRVRRRRGTSRRTQGDQQA